MDEHDKVTKEKDQLKKQNTQLLKLNEQLKKKRKGSTDKLLASPDPPPEEDSTSLEIEFTQQRADDADKRAEEARARVIERAKEAEKYTRAAHTGAESRVANLEKQLDEKYVQVKVSCTGCWDFLYVHHMLCKPCPIQVMLCITEFQ